MGLDIYFQHRTTKDIGHFRKVNFLVKYFTDLGFDVENQTPFEINRDMVINLIDRCRLVLGDHSLAKKLLPTMNGFFFGSTNYDDHYFANVEAVKEYCEKDLLPQFGELGEDESIIFSTWY